MVWGLLRFGGLRRRGLEMFRGWVAVGDVRDGGMENLGGCSYRRCDLFF